eukprot:scaffold95545_cov19-Prasinocladus_malaysianus.AAC.1
MAIAFHMRSLLCIATLCFVALTDYRHGRAHTACCMPSIHLPYRLHSYSHWRPLLPNNSLIIAKQSPSVLLLRPIGPISSCSIEADARKYRPGRG